MKRVPIGIENFKEMIDQDCYYVDKTGLIKTVLDQKVAIYTRPRRFGKTLNMNMLYYFFSNKEQDNAYLFEGLKISEDAAAMEHQNQYPVIFLTLKELNRESTSMQIEKYRAIIAEIVEANEYLLNSHALSQEQKKLLVKYQTKHSSDSDLRDALQNLSQCLCKHYGKKVLLLIDEYDVPLQSAYLHGFYDEMVVFLRNALGAALKTNDALEKGIMTGCLRIAKESIFTGLNNFSVFSILDQVTADCFGFTEKETESLLKDYDLDAYRDRVKDWYDGYQFGNMEIYNPWSLLNYVYKAIHGDTEPESFWANTSGNDLVYRYIRSEDNQMKEDFDTLVCGRTIEKVIKSELTYREMDDLDNVYSFLLFTGYLKTVKRQSLTVFQLTIPNREIRHIYLSIFSEWFDKRTKEAAPRLYEALINEDTFEAMRILSNTLFDSISYFDYGEKFYHGLVLGMLSSYSPMSNVESGLGRYDIAVLPNMILQRGMVLELKCSLSMENLKADSQKAAEQIKEKKYMEGLAKKGYEDMIGYGISFYKKTCYITQVKK